MTEAAARIFMPVNRLAHALDAQDNEAVDFDDLVNAAEHRVAGMFQTLESHVLADTATILQIMQKGAEQIFAERGTIAAAAARVAEIAGSAGRAPLGGVAKGLAVLIHGLDDQGAWRLDIVAVHARALDFASASPGELDMVPLLAELSTLRTTAGIFD